MAAVAKDSDAQDRLARRLLTRAERGAKDEAFVTGLLRKYAGGRDPGAMEKAALKPAGEALGDEAPAHLDLSTQRRMEALTGADLKGVRVHTGELAQEMAETTGAKAFTLNDRDVFFAGGEFNPRTPQGQALLAHELTHVAERQQGVFPALQRPTMARQSEARAEHAEKLALALEERADEEATRVAEATPVEAPPVQKGEEPLSYGHKRDWLIERAWRLLEDARRRERDRIGDRLDR
jgi:hypothetical protein